MYCKLFASLYQGTLRGKSNEILVFTNLLAHCDKDGFVDKHWRAIAEEVGLSIEEVKEAVLSLEAPDPESRSPEEGGARLIRLDEHRAWGWRVVNYAKYRTIRNADDRREQNRLAKQREREKKKSAKSAKVSNQSSKSSRSAQAEVEVEVDAEAIYELYPRKVGKPKALEAISKAMKIDDPKAILERTALFGSMAKNFTDEQMQFVPHPSTWFNQQRYNDDPSTWERKSNARTERVGGSAETASDRRNAFMGLTREDELAAGKRMEEKIKRDEAARDRATAEWRRKYENGGSNAGLQPELPSSGQSVPKPENHPHGSNGSGKDNSDAEGLRMDGRNPLGSVASELEVHPKKEVEGF